MPRCRLAFLCLFALLLTGTPAQAQQRENALSNTEIEKLRDLAATPNERVLAFVAFVDERTKIMQTLATGPRKPGREEDLHDLMEQLTSIVDDLEDNLDDYGPRHRDLRKALPKLIAATERWATVVKTPADHETYNVTRRLTLEAIHDVHNEATKLLEEQKAWFKEHPPSKEQEARPEK